MSPSLRTALGLLIALALVPPGLAAALVVYSTGPTQSLATTPPVVLVGVGADSGPNAYVSGFSLSPNATRFTATVTGLGGATVVVTELFTVRNVDTAARSVTLSADQVTNVHVEQFLVEVRNGGGTLVSTLDLKAGSPGASLGSVPAGAQYSCLLKLKLAPGAGANNATVVPTIRVIVVG